ncbi:MAG TPA: hypothetical protein VK172_10555 [Lentimicrobium sp.]|nr:hypothetical protein [Lentimicrobium sp.]
MTELEKNSQRWAKKTAEMKRLKERIDKLQKKYDKWYSSGFWFWGDRLVRPIYKMVKAKFPEIRWDKGDRLVPMGIMSRISVFGMYKNKTVMMSFLPTDLDKGLISFETDKKLEEYPENSIAAWNNMGYEQIQLTDIQLLYDYVQKQIDKIEENRNQIKAKNV